MSTMTTAITWHTLSAMLSQPSLPCCHNHISMLSQPSLSCCHNPHITMLSQPSQPSLSCCHNHLCHVVTTISAMLSQPSLACCHNPLCHVVTTLAVMLSQPSLPWHTLSATLSQPSLPPPSRCHTATTLTLPYCHHPHVAILPPPSRCHTATTLTLPYCHNLWLHTEQHLLTCRLKLPKRDGCGLRTSVRDSAVRHVHKACHARCERHDSLEISLPHLQRGLLGSSKFGDGMIITVKINPRCL